MSTHDPELQAQSAGSREDPRMVSGTVFFHELSLNHDNIRDPKIKEFATSHNFIPYYRSEITISGKKLGLADALFEARYAGNNINRTAEAQQRAAEETYATVEGYLGKSQADLSKLRLAFPAGEGLPSPKEIKNNPLIVDVVAGYILAFRKLESGYWPAWNAGVLVSAISQIKEQLALVPDEEAVALWDMARISHNERYRFWNSQLIEVKDNRIVQEINSLRDSRHRSQSESGAAQPQVVEYGSMTEQITEPESLPEQSRPANMLPDGSMLIEGVNDVPVVTDRPVHVLPRTEKPEPPRAERLFAVEASDVHVSQAGSKSSRKPKPYRARYKDTTDYVTRQLKPSDDEQHPIFNPDADIDEIFGPPISR